MLFGLRIDDIPLPVQGLVDLLGGLGMAAQASLGDLRSGIEFPVERLELAVIGG